MSNNSKPKAVKPDKEKFYQSETVVIKRSQINFAPYNPKNHSKDAIAEQRKNFKRVGFLGGVVWNVTTGNIVSGHKRVMAMDLEYKYDGSPETDYDIKVEKVEFDEKTEKEQNIYMDSHNTNTVQDLELLANLIPEIDYKNAGLSLADLNIMGIDIDVKNISDETDNSELVEIGSEVLAVSQPQKPVDNRPDWEKKGYETAKDMRADFKKQSVERNIDNQDCFITLTFSSGKAKHAFMERFDMDPFEKYVKGEIFSEMIERIE